jgi:HEPN domain-containing protein
MAMSAEEKFEYWLDIAQSDLKTAESMLTVGHWVWVAFMCQQAVEKLVKGLYILYLDDNVPKTHTIRTIIRRYEKKLSVEIPAETIHLFDRLSVCYLNNRYPDYKNKLGTQIKEQEAVALLSQT